MHSFFFALTPYPSAIVAQGTQGKGDRDIMFEVRERSFIDTVDQVRARNAFSALLTYMDAHFISRDFPWRYIHLHVREIR